MENISKVLKKLGIVGVEVDPDKGMTYLVDEKGNKYSSGALVGDHKEQRRDAAKRKVAEAIPEPLQAGYSGFQKGSEIVESMDDLEGIEKDYPLISKIGRGLGLGSSVAGLAGLAKTAATKGLKRGVKEVVKPSIPRKVIEVPVNASDVTERAIRRAVKDNMDETPISQLMNAGKKAEAPDVVVPKVKKEMMEDILKEMRDNAVKDVHPVKRVDNKMVEELGKRARREWLEAERAEIVKREMQAELRRRKK